MRPPSSRGSSARPTKGVAPASHAAAWSMASNTVRATAVPCPGYVRPSALGSRTRRPAGPTTSMSPTSRPLGGPSPRSLSSCNARGPTTSPHALSRGNVDLSTKATSAPPRASTSEAILPAGPPPTTSTSKRDMLTLLPPPSRIYSDIFSPLEERMPTVTAGDRNRFAQQLFSSLPKRYDRLAEILSMGQNGRWRRAMVDHIAPTSPALILDVASGTAGVALQLASRTSSHVVGVDLTMNMLARGRENVARAGMSQRINLVAGRAEQLPFPDGTFDALTFTYLLRYVDDPQATLGELARVVKPGGAVASLEFFLPPNPFWRFWWWLYTRIALPLGGLITGGREWLKVGRFLGPNISQHYRTYPLSWTEEAWRKAGFEDVGVRVMSLGGGLVMWGTRRGEWGHSTGCGA